MGRYWLKLVKSVGNFDKPYIDHYGFTMPDPPMLMMSTAPLILKSGRVSAAVAGRRMDGGKLYQHLKSGGHSYDGISTADDSLPEITRRIASAGDQIRRLVRAVVLPTRKDR